MWLESRKSGEEGEEKVCVGFVRTTTSERSRALFCLLIFCCCFDLGRLSFAGDKRLRINGRKQKKPHTKSNSFTRLYVLPSQALMCNFSCI